jgi:hypothetical protein
MRSNKSLSFSGALKGGASLLAVLLGLIVNNPCCVVSPQLLESVKEFFGEA